MIVKTGKYYNIKSIGHDGQILGLSEEDLYALFWDITKVLAPLRGETSYPEGGFYEKA